MTAMLEAVFAYAFLKHTNVTGTRHGILMMAFLLCDCMKYIFGGWLILNLAAGNGIGKDTEGAEESMPFTSVLVTLLFAAQQSVWRIVMSHRSSNALYPGFLLVNALPGMLIFAVFFVWAVRKLSGLIQTLVEQKQTSSLKVFITLRRALIAGLCMSVAVSSMQIAGVSPNDLPPWAWRYAWFLDDGASHLVYIMSVVGMMILWWPGDSSRSFGYSPQATNELDASDLDQPDGVVCGVSDGEEEQQHELPLTDDDPFDSPRCTNVVAPEPIGARHHEPQDLL